MSALKKFIPQKQHFERQQPQHRRERYGLLEKKKDYILRARDFHRKEKRIKALQARARSKNEDEFYHSMIHSRRDAKTGKHIVEKRLDAYTGDELKLLKSQDIQYVRMHVQINKQRIARLQAELLVPTTRQPNRIVFVDSSEEEIERSTPPAPPAPPKPHLNTSEESKKRKELHARQKRFEQLKGVLEELELQRHLTYSKGRKYKVGEDAKGNAVYKWRRERET